MLTGADGCLTGASKIETGAEWRTPPAFTYMSYGEKTGEKWKKMEKNAEKSTKRTNADGNNDGGYTHEGSTGAIHREHTHCASGVTLVVVRFLPI